MLLLSALGLAGSITTDIATSLTGGLLVGYFVFFLLVGLVVN